MLQLLFTITFCLIGISGASAQALFPNCDKGPWLEWSKVLIPVFTSGLVTLFAYWLVKRKEDKKSKDNEERARTFEPYVLSQLKDAIEDAKKDFVNRGHCYDLATRAKSIVEFAEATTTAVLNHTDNKTFESFVKLKRITYQFRDFLKTIAENSDLWKLDALTTENGGPQKTNKMAAGIEQRIQQYKKNNS